MTEEQIEKLAGLLETEKPLAEIAADLGMSYHSFRVRLAEAGFRIRRRLEPIQPIRPVGLAEREPVEAVAA